MRTVICYPDHANLRGTVQENFIDLPIGDLSGAYLDYALACAERWDTIKFRFALNLEPCEVEVVAEGGSTRMWSPTQDQDLAKRLTAKHLGRTPEVVSTADLREIVASTLGAQIKICKLTQGA